jgi:hypothetical protein
VRLFDSFGRNRDLVVVVELEDRDGKVAGCGVMHGKADAWGNDIQGLDQYVKTS